MPTLQPVLFAETSRLKFAKYSLSAQVVKETIEITFFSTNPNSVFEAATKFLY